MVPQISLVYNSQGTNGIAGYRWDIAGISTITRIPSTKFHDGTINPIDGGATDRFALDGQRLLKKNGGEYFDAVGAGQGNLYELENFSNIKITSANQTNNPFSTVGFRVSYPDGSFAVYGAESNQRTNMVWAISYWENAQGVRISYTYNNVSGKKLTIASIKYGSTTTNIPINEIQFIYKNRIRPDQGYFLGQTLTDDTILSKIKVIGNGVGFRNYVLNYDETFLKYERLISITEKNGDETKSYNPTTFEYEKTVASETIEAKPTTATIGMSNINSDTSATISGDFDGDGKMDFVLYPTKGDLAKKKFWLFTDINNNSLNIPSEVASGSFEEIFPSTFLFQANIQSDSQGITAIQSATDSKAVNFNTYFNSIYGVGVMNTKQVTFPVRNITNCVGNSFRTTDKSQSKKYFNGDFNGDGLTDVIAIDNEEKQEAGPCFSASQYNSTYASTGKVYFIDLDNRKTSNFWIEAGTLTDHFRNYKTFSDQDRIETFDVNGDGKTDILHFKNGSVTVYTLDNTNKLVLLWKTTDANIVTNLSILPGDYNGDGKMDFIIPKNVGLTNSNDYFKFLSKGNAFEKFSQWYDIPNLGSQVISESGGGVSINNLIPLDFNGDGKTDIVHFRTIYGNTAKQGAIIIRSYNNNGTAFSFSSESYIKSTPLIKSYAAPIFLSPNRNNQYVEVGAITDNLIYTFNSLKNFSKETLLSTITTGNGVKETISYSSLQQDQYESFYTPSPFVETFPNIDISVAPNFKIVTKLEKKSADGYKKQLFNYYGAVSNTEGLGFLGFRAVKSTNWHNDSTSLISNVSKYDIGRRGANVENYSVLGQISLSGTTSPDNFITKSIIDYNTAVEALQSNKVFKLKKNSIKEFNGLESTSSETAIEYNANNNPTKSTSLLKEGGTTVQTTVSSVIYKDPTVTPYVIGRPASKTQSVAITGSTMSTEENYDYTANGLLTEIKKKGTGTDYITEKNIFDAFGNVTKKTITAGDITRETSYVYDPSGRFLIKSTDVEGLNKTFTYNLNNGLLSSETNQNGLTTTYDYDSWFKKTKTTDYLGKTNKYTYTRSAEKTVVTTEGDDGSASEETFDDLGRKIKTGFKNVTGTFSYTSYLYDILDRNYKVSEPYFGTSPTEWNETTYDEYGRIKKSSAFTGKTVDFSYLGLTTKADEGYKSKSTTKNVIGNIVSMTDAPGGTINYTYFANGNLKESDFGGTKTTITQDGWGRKTSLVDPSAGTYSYDYNALGETTSVTTPNGLITYKLNTAGKLIEKTIVGAKTNSKTTYTYDDKMLLSNSKFEDLTNGTNTIINTYTYDDSKRISAIKETTPYAVFTKDFSYDVFGRKETEKSTATAGGKTSTKTIKNTYLNGSHSQILDNDTSAVLWETSAVNAKGQLTKALSGPITITNTYDTGFASQIKYDKTADSANILTLTTDFDKSKGNLTSRTNNLFNWDESFEYDDQDRLTKFANGKGVQVTQEYDDQGRILKNTLGTYTYDAVKPYQNTSIEVTQEAGSYYANRGDVFNDSMENETGWANYDPSTITFDKIIAAHSGNTSLKINNTATSEKVIHSEKWIAIDNTVDTEYTYSAWVYSDGPQAEMFLFMKTPEETGYFTYVNSVTTTETGKWTKIEKTVLVPSNIKKINIRLDNNAQGNVWFDDIQIRKASDALLSEKVLDVRYNVFKSPVTIEETGVDKISFDYNDNNDRTAMFYGSLQDHTDKLLRPYRKYYSADGSMEIKENRVTGAFEFVTYIGGDGYSAPIVYKSDGGTNQNYLYLQRDYQGSILAITNQNGDVVEKRLFDAWGNILKVQDGAGNTLAGLTVLDRGYTGHEHLQSVGIIHMNGRLYDPKLHRFLQPDNYVQDPFNTQNYNRYGYCWNNPLKYTDPNGEWIHIVVGAVIGGLVNWGIHGFQLNAKGALAFGIGAAGGALMASGNVAGLSFFQAGMVTAGYALAGTMFTGMANNMAFGDPMPTMKQMAIVAAVSFVTGGLLRAPRVPVSEVSELTPVGLVGGQAESAITANAASTTIANTASQAAGEATEEIAKAGLNFKTWTNAEGQLQFSANAIHLDNVAVNASKGDFSTIFRAVSKDELDDIIQYGFRTKAGGYESGKLFAPTMEEAAKFGKNNYMYDNLPNTIMKVKIPNSVLDDAFKFSADGMDAISIPAEQLKLLKGTPLNSSPLIK